MFVFVKYQKINKNPKLACMLPSGFPTISHFQPKSRGRAEVITSKAPGRCQGVCAHLGCREVRCGDIQAVDSKLILRLLTSFFSRDGKSARNGSFFLGSGYLDFSPHRCQHMALQRQMLAVVRKFAQRDLRLGGAGPGEVRSQGTELYVAPSPL